MLPGWDPAPGSCLGVPVGDRHVPSGRGTHQGEARERPRGFRRPRSPGRRHRWSVGPSFGPIAAQGLRTRERASPIRVCNAVCNGLGHNVTQPGTTWHNREASRTPQAPPCGTRRHILTQRGTTWHNPTPCLRVLQGLPHKPPSSASKTHFGGDRQFRVAGRSRTA
jgi:hypothetical protein